MPCRCGYLRDQVAELMQLLEDADIPDPSSGSWPVTLLLYSRAINDVVNGHFPTKNSELTDQKLFCSVNFS